MNYETEVTPGFGLPVLLPGRWTLLSDEMTAALLARFSSTGWREAGLVFDAARVLPLGFYPGWMLCDLRLQEEGPDGHGTERGALAVLYGPDGFTPLDKGLGVLLDHAEMHGITLETCAQALAYLQFAGLFGLSEAGPCHVLSPETRLGVGGMPGRDAPEVTVLPDPPPSPLDKVRAPEAARIVAEVIEGGALDRVTYRLSRAGDITHLGRDTLATGVRLRPDLRFSGAMRFLEPERAE